jgi:dTDP-4-amino-4,6-dideoxygalactose transaminase
VPCDVQAIRTIADRHRLPVIYDAAQAFGVRSEGASVLRHGDASTVSFHATKVFNTFEGGAIVCPDAKTKKRIDHLKNFGFVDEVTVIAPGINGKMSEINAAFGLVRIHSNSKTPLFQHRPPRLFLITAVLLNPFLAALYLPSVSLQKLNQIQKLHFGERNS